MNDETIPEMDAAIERVAKACSVPDWWVSIRYAKLCPDDEADGPWRWSVDVTVIRTASRKNDQAQLSGYGSTLASAAAEAIDHVERSYASGEYAPPAATKRRKS